MRACVNCEILYTQCWDQQMFESHEIALSMWWREKRSHQGRHLENSSKGIQKKKKGQNNVHIPENEIKKKILVKIYVGCEFNVCCRKLHKRIFCTIEQAGTHQSIDWWFPRVTGENFYSLVSQTISLIKLKIDKIAILNIIINLLMILF